MYSYIHVYMLHDYSNDKHILLHTQIIARDLITHPPTHTHTHTHTIRRVAVMGQFQIHETISNISLTNNILTIKSEQCKYNSHSIPV